MESADMESSNKAIMVKKERESSLTSGEDQKHVMAQMKKDLLLYNFESSRFFSWLSSVIILEC